MKGRITRLIDDQQRGMIAGEDGVDYVFASGSLLDVTFGSLHVGVPVTFVPTQGKNLAAAVRIDGPGRPR
jgi:hypothetical protein